jgi:hypothetical protein
MDAKNIPIDADAFVVHNAETYMNELGDIMAAHGYYDGLERSPKR